MKGETKHCANPECRVVVTPATWYRTVTGFLLCGRCYWRSRMER